VFVLEHELHVHEEGVVYSVEDVLLEADVLELLMLEDHVLPDALHGVEAAVRDMLDEEDLAE